MLRQLDHVAMVVRDLDSATDDYRRRGFTVTPGGEHADGLTHNALIPFADGSYLELVAFHEPRRGVTQSCASAARPRSSFARMRGTAYGTSASRTASAVSGSASRPR